MCRAVHCRRRSILARFLTVDAVAHLKNICTHIGLECRESKRRFDEEEDFKARAREAVTKLQAGDPAFLEAWRLLCEISRKVCACQVLRRAG